MQSIQTYFNDLATDIRCVFQDTQSSVTDREVRVASISSRVFGGFLVAYGVTGAFKIMSGVVLGPQYLIVSVFMLTLGHDMIQVGYNLRKFYLVLNSLTDSDSGIIRSLANFISGTYQLGSAVVQQDVRGTPFMIHDTVIFEPIYRLFAKGT